jgi:hypothetical protein
MGGLGIFALIVLLTLVATILGAVVWLAMLPLLETMVFLLIIFSTRML